MTAPGVRAVEQHRRRARRTLPSLLRYRFLHEYGYDKGEVVVDAIVADICTVVRNYFVTGDKLEPASSSTTARRPPNGPAKPRRWPTRSWCRCG